MQPVRISFSGPERPGGKLEFSLEENPVLCICGKRASGKTTALRMLKLAFAILSAKDLNSLPDAGFFVMLAEDAPVRAEAQYWLEGELYTAWSLKSGLAGLLDRLAALSCRSAGKNCTENRQTVRNLPGRKSGTAKKPVLFWLLTSASSLPRCGKERQILFCSPVLQIARMPFWTRRLPVKLPASWMTPSSICTGNRWMV